MKISIKLLSSNGKIPTSTPGNAGFDLYAAETVVIPPGERRLIKTDVAFGIPVGYYGRISDRSGMAYKNGATCIGKIVDPSYTGNVGIILFNTDKRNDIVINIGDRPAQIIFEKYLKVEFEEVPELGITERGDKGYGSSGGISIVFQTTTKEKIFTQKTFKDIYDTIKPDSSIHNWTEVEQEDVAERYNLGKFLAVQDMFDYFGFYIENWSPQELLVISEKLGLPIV